MNNLLEPLCGNRELWFIAGSQRLYGEETLRRVETHSRQVAAHLNDLPQGVLPVSFKQVACDTESVIKLCRQANAAESCIGLVLWMHTFSPAKMWLTGLRELRKPLLHFHTQFHRAIPWDSIDMDYMNLHQAAHGGREFGFAASRLRKNRHVLVGHWQDEQVCCEFADWSAVALGWAKSQATRIARFGDNMRDVAVTEGDKVEAQLELGWRVDGYSLEDLYQAMDEAKSEVPQIVAECLEQYEVPPLLQEGGKRHHALVASAKIEAGLRRFLSCGDFTGFTTNFENLGRLPQMPGLAVQRLMHEGYGFGAEGDWKTAAYLHIVKTICSVHKGGASFMEDYTYHFGQEHGEAAVLGAHMLEICPSIAQNRPRLDIFPLGISGKDDPVRLIFAARPGKALNTTLLDLGGRFRLLAASLNVIPLPQEMPKLPVAHALWLPEPSFKIATAAWIYAGGAHHTCFAQDLSPEQLRMFAEMAGIEFVCIDENTELQAFQDRLRWNDLYYSQMHWAQQRG